MNKHNGGNKSIFDHYYKRKKEKHMTKILRSLIAAYDIYLQSLYAFQKIPFPYCNY